MCSNYLLGITSPYLRLCDTLHFGTLKIFLTILIEDNSLKPKISRNCQPNHPLNPHSIDHCNPKIPHSSPYHFLEPPASLKPPPTSQITTMPRPPISSILLTPTTLVEFCVQFWSLYHGQDHLVLSNTIQ